MNTRTAALLVKRVLRSPRLFAAAMSAYPPLFAAGVRVRDISDDWSSAHLILKVNRLNNNAHGAAFGGSLFSMTDAMFGTLVMQRLGREYEAWTRTGTFQYINPGRNNAHATVQITDAMVEQIKREIASDGFCNIPYTTVITNDDGSTAALASKNSTAGCARVNPTASRSVEARPLVWSTAALSPTKLGELLFFPWRRRSRGVRSARRHPPGSNTTPTHHTTPPR